MKDIYTSAETRFSHSPSALQPSLLQSCCFWELRSGTSAVLCRSVRCKEDMLGVKQNKSEISLEEMRSASAICDLAENFMYLHSAYRQQPRNDCGGISGVRGFCLPTRKNLVLSAALLSMKLTGASSIAFTLLVITR